MGELRVDQPAPGVRRLTIDRPEVRNAISLPLQRELDRVLASVAGDDTVRSVIVAGAGPVAFSAGYDLAELAEWTTDEVADAAAERDELIWRFVTFPKPVVAAVHGAAHGAGTILAACADIRVGGPHTRFTVTAARYGGANLTWLLDELIGAGLTRDLLMTSRTIDGDEAHRIGLLSRLADDGDVEAAALRAAIELAGQPPEALREIKALLLAGPGRSLRSRYDRENEIARTLLRPRPISDVFADFFDRDRARAETTSTP
ncbi:enoyl-CoA hydratase/isomerase family protein [Gordonia insulae]|uniref:Short-chain-enoyl-CoA hydratase n=1 Tax=Gordonia insulae TaxID=2420509 RepID=A0A3G8JSI6_9ACTN|nr:enoyl-CoA hydratase/isomerase family protein [Gordonia insulae]AZG47685.1 Short-chain-enoyl-CoA hydratase [Gordonia insulae]